MVVSMLHYQGNNADAMGTQSRINPVSSSLWWLAAARLLIVCMLAVLAAPGWSQTVATSVSLVLPSALAYDAQGDLYIAERGAHLVRRLAPDGTLSTIAGTGVQGFSGDGGPAVGAQLDSPSGLAVDSGGDLYIADTHNHRIRKISVATGVITTVAGTGVRGFSGDSGPATLGRIDSPTAVAVSPTKDLYLADTGNQRIRKVSATTGLISTVAGDGVQGFFGDTGSAVAAWVDSPTGLAVDAGGNLYLADTHNHRIRRVDAATGVITTVSGASAGAPGLATASGGTGPGLNAFLGLPRGVAIGPDGSVYFADSADHRVRRIAADGMISVVAGGGAESFSGDGAPALAAALDSPQSVAVSPGGLVTVADTANGRIRQLDTASAPGPGIHTIAGLSAALSSGVLGLTGPSVVPYGTGEVTATLASSGAATGQVTFVDVSTPAQAVVGMVTIAGNSATLNVAALGAGTHAIVARYSGDSAHAGVQSGALTLSVTPRSVTAAAQPVSIVYGQAVPAIGGTLAGVLPQDTGKVTAVFASSATGFAPAGVYPVTATLSGTASGNYSLDGVTGSVAIGRAPTFTGALLSATSAAMGDPVSVTIQTVSGTSGTPTGSVTLFDGSSPAATAQLVGGSAHFAINSLGAGVHALTGTYPGDANFLSSTSLAVSISVGAGPDFSLGSTGPSARVIPSGSSATYTFFVTPQGGSLASPISFAVDGLPPGATASLDPAYLPPGGQKTPFTLTVQTTKSALAEMDSGRSGPLFGGQGPLIWAGVYGPSALVLRRRRGRLRSGKARFSLFTIIFAFPSCILFATLTSGCADRVRTGSETQTAPTYTLTVTGTATSASGTALKHSATVTLQVL